MNIEPELSPRFTARPASRIRRMALALLVALVALALPSPSDPALKLREDFEAVDNSEKWQQVRSGPCCSCARWDAVRPCLLRPADPRIAFRLLLSDAPGAAGHRWPNGLRPRWAVRFCWAVRRLRRLWRELLPRWQLLSRGIQETDRTTQQRPRSGIHLLDGLHDDAARERHVCRQNDHPKYLSLPAAWRGQHRSRPCLWPQPA